MAEDTNKETKSFLESLPEDLREANELKTFKNVEDLGKSYVELSKLASSKHKGVSEEDTVDDIVKKSKIFNGIKDEYKIPELEHPSLEKLNGVFSKYGVNPKVANRLFKDLETLNSDEVTAIRTAREKQYQKDLEKVLEGVDNRDELEGRAFKLLGVDREGFEKALGSRRNNPVVVKALLALAKSAEGAGDKPPDTKGKGEGSKTSVSEAKQAYLDAVNHPAFNDPKAIDHHTLNKKADDAMKILRANELKTGKPTAF